MKPALIDYTNHRGERRKRHILPRGIYFGVSPHHPGEQWILIAIDVDRNELRDFAMCKVHSWSQ